MRCDGLFPRSLPFSLSSLFISPSPSILCLPSFSFLIRPHFLPSFISPSPSIYSHPSSVYLSCPRMSRSRRSQHVSRPREDGPAPASLPRLLCLSSSDSASSGKQLLLASSLFVSRLFLVFINHRFDYFIIISVAIDVLPCL